VKRTLKRESKVLEIVKRKTIVPYLLTQIESHGSGVYFIHALGQDGKCFSFWNFH
jgi:hypothetical protein